MSKATSRFSTWVRSLTEGAELAEGRRPDSGGPGPAALGLSTRGRPQSFFAFIVTSILKAKMWIFTGSQNQQHWNLCFTVYRAYLMYFYSFKHISNN